MDFRVVVLLLFLVPFCLKSQTTTDVKDVQVAKLRLQIGTNSAKYFSSQVETITGASTHFQAPTARAVWDLFGTAGGITGSGAAGQVSYWTGASAQSGSNNLFWDAVNSRLGINTTTPTLPLVVNSAGLVAKFGTDPGVIAIGTENTVGAFVGGYYADGGSASTVYFGQNAYYSGGFQKPNAGAAASFLLLQGGGQYYYPSAGMSGAVPTAYYYAMNPAGYVSFGNTTVGTTHRFHVYGISGGTENILTLSTPSGALTTGDEHRMSFAQQGTRLGGVVGRWNGTQYDVAIDGFNGAVSRVATFSGNGNVGIGTGNTAPSRKLHVEGTARITGSAGTGTGIMLRDASGDISNAVLGAGLTLSGGTLSGGGSNWTVSGSDIYRNSNIAVKTTSFAGAAINLEGLGASNIGIRISPSSTPINSEYLRIQGAATTDVKCIISEISTTGDAQYTFNNTGTAAGSKSTLTVGVGGTAAGDAAVRFAVTGGNTTSIGTDNSVAGDPFRIVRNADLSAVTTGATFTDTRFGMNNITPATTLDLSGNTDGITVTSGTDAQRPSGSTPVIRYNTTNLSHEVRDANSQWHRLATTSFSGITITAGASSGTGSTITSTGNDLGGTVTVTIGTTPAANNTLFTFNYAVGFSAAAYASVTAANANCAGIQFYTETGGTGNFVVKVNGTLVTGQAYKFNYIIQN